MRKVFRGINIDIKNKKDLSNTLNQIFTKFNKRVCDYYDISSGEKLAFWLNYWCHNYIPIESTFDYEKELLRYKRGDVLSFNLGFNVGSEQGGLHYGIVLNNDNDKTSPVITVIPMSTHEKGSKEDKEYLKYEVLIPSNIFNKEIKRLKDRIVYLNSEKSKKDIDSDHLKDIKKELKQIQKELEKIDSKESIYAQPLQIKSISKLRIYYPTEVDDILYNVNVGDDVMEDIEKKIVELFFGKNMEK